MILSYEDYLDLGGTLKDAAFDMINVMAEAKIKLQIRSQFEKITPNIKYCAFQKIKVLEEAAMQENAPSSFNNDGVSVSFAKRSDSETNEKINQIILEYLNEETDSDGIPLLYRGVNV